MSGLLDEILLLSCMAAFVIGVVSRGRKPIRIAGREQSPPACARNRPGMLSLLPVARGAPRTLITRGTARSFLVPRRASGTQPAADHFRACDEFRMRRPLTRRCGESEPRRHRLMCAGDGLAIAKLMLPLGSNAHGGVAVAAGLALDLYPAGDVEIDGGGRIGRWRAPVSGARFIIIPGASSPCRNSASQCGLCVQTMALIGAALSRAARLR